MKKALSPSSFPSGLTNQFQGYSQQDGRLNYGQPRQQQSRGGFVNMLKQFFTKPDSYKNRRAASMRQRYPQQQEEDYQGELVPSGQGQLLRRSRYDQRSLFSTFFE